MQQWWLHPSFVMRKCEFYNIDHHKLKGKLIVLCIFLNIFFKEYSNSTLGGGGGYRQEALDTKVSSMAASTTPVIVCVCVF